MASLLRFDGWCKSATGPAVPGSQVFVCQQPANLVPTLKNGPPSPLVPIYAGPEGDPGQLIAQPIISNTFGLFSFYVTAGVYTVLVYLNGALQQSYPDTSIGGTPTYTRKNVWIKNALGVAQVGARVIVASQPAQVPASIDINNFPSPLASTYRDPNGLVPISQSVSLDAQGNTVFQSLTTDGNGFTNFYMASGSVVTIAVYSAAGRLLYFLPDQMI